MGVDDRKRPHVARLGLGWLLSGVNSGRLKSRSWPSMQVWAATRACCQAGSISMNRAGAGTGAVLDDEKAAWD